MKVVWKLGNLEDVEGKYGAEDISVLQLIVYTINEADSRLVLENKTSNTALIISMKNDSIVIAEKDGTIGKETATWVPYITYAIGAVEDFFSGKDQTFSVWGEGKKKIEIEGGIHSELQEMEQESIKWLVYEHRECLMKG